MFESKKTDGIDALAVFPLFSKFLNSFPGLISSEFSTLSKTILLGFLVHFQSPVTSYSEMPEKFFFVVDYSPYLINHQTDLQTTTEFKNF